MNIINITIKARAGTEVHGVCHEAQLLANFLGQNLTFDFNGDTVHILAGGNPDQSAEIWGLRRYIRQQRDGK